MEFWKKTLEEFYQIFVEELGLFRRQVLDFYLSLCELNKLKEAVMQASETKEESSLHEVILRNTRTLYPMLVRLFLLSANSKQTNKSS